MKLACEMKRGLPVLALILLIVCACSKKSVTDKGTPYDPSTPVTISRISPESGGASTQLMIYGSNFGNDTALIKVYVNGHRAPLIGTTGSSLYVLVPSKSGSGDVKVLVGDPAQEVIAPVGFTYFYYPRVSTLAGFTDKAGKTAIVDGPIDKAQFEEPYWLCFDEDKNIYLLEEYRGLRFINAARTEVSTKFRSGNGMGRPRTLAFNPTWDTLYITNDQDNWT
ncbi:MAG TPA: IPT/TIG domain-containing protein, partial [Niastella sp.]